VQRISGHLSLYSLALMLISTYIVAIGLSQIARGVEFSLLLMMTWIGLLIGVIVAAFRLTTWAAGTLIAISGWLVILLRVGRIGPVLLEILHAFWRFVDPTWNPLADTAAFLESLARLREPLLKLAELLGVLLSRTMGWLSGWAQGVPTFDPVAVAVLWSAILWGAAAWAGWSIRAKKHPLISLAPMTALLGLALGSVGAKPTALSWSLGAIVAIMILLSQDLRERSWMETGIQISSKVRHGLVIWSLLLAALLMIVAGLSQSLSLRKMVQSIQGFGEGQAGREELARQALGLEQQQNVDPGMQANLEELRSPGLPRRHLIQSGPELSDQLALLIRVQGQERGGPRFEIDEPIIRYYWRSNTYDIYSGRGWRTGPTESVEYDGREQLVDELPVGRRKVELSIRTVPQLAGLVFTAGDLLSVDQEFRVEWRTSEDAFGAVLRTANTRSRVQSMAAEADASDLRSAQQDYPDWVLDRYLKLPENTPDRVTRLARDLTATSPTAYDRAIAIESYLRRFEYTLELEAPPAGQDIVDYFLFDLQKGYCDYFASSMVVLARAAGLPARLAVGYVTGTYDFDLRAYLVTEAEAHSWPEIYFPEFGWLKFEPTSGRPGLARSATAPDVSDLLFESEADTEPGGLSRLALDWGKLAQFGSDLAKLVMVVLAVAALGWVFLGQVRLRRSTPESVAAQAYIELRRAAGRLGLSIHRGGTPYEIAQELSRNLMAQIARPGFGRLFVPCAGEVQELVEAFVTTSYRPASSDKPDKIDIHSNWRRLRRRLLLARAMKSVGKFDLWRESSADQSNLADSRPSQL
jgi:transglutaminase-like putative cysteine protease